NPGSARPPCIGLANLRRRLTRAERSHNRVHIMNGLREWSSELPNAHFLVVAGALPLGSVCAQDIEPRRWAHLPLGTDIVGLGYIYTKGDLQFDPALRLEDVKVDMHTFVASYNHYFGLFDKTARLDVQLPWQDGDWSGLLDGTPASTG